MKTSILWMLAITLAVLSAGCGRAAVTRGARALLPLQSQDTERVWVYMDTNDVQRDGVYRCIDQGSQILCVKAQIQ